jgi:peptide/nickel transport system permease protein
MSAFLLRRFIYLVLLVIVSTSVAYVLAATQLNPRSRYEGRNPPPPPEVIDAVLDELNMNNRTPLVARFTRWAGGVVRGDLGRTIDNNSVAEEIDRRMWVSLRLVLLGVFVGTTLGVAAGAFSAVKQHRPVDHLVTVFSFVVLSTPVVVIAVLYKNAGIALNDALGFTGDVKLLYTTTGAISGTPCSTCWAAIFCAPHAPRGCGARTPWSNTVCAPRSSRWPRFLRISSPCCSSAPRLPSASSAGTAWANISSIP